MIRWSAGATAAHPGLALDDPVAHSVQILTRRQAGQSVRQSLGRLDAEPQRRLAEQPGALVRTTLREAQLAALGGTFGAYAGVEPIPMRLRAMACSGANPK